MAVKKHNGIVATTKAKHIKKVTQKASNSSLPLPLRLYISPENIGLHLAIEAEKKAAKSSSLTPAYRSSMSLAVFTSVSGPHERRRF